MSKESLLTSTSTIGTTLAAIVIDRYGTEGLYFEPETLRDALESMANDRIPEINYDKIHAWTTAISTDFFYYDPQAFNLICNALGGFNVEVDFNRWEPPEAEEMAWTVLEVFLNDVSSGGEEEFAQRFSPLMKHYMRELLSGSGVALAPQSLRFVVPETLDVSPLAEDPTLYQMVLQFQRLRLEEVETYVEKRYKQLLEELESAELDIDHELLSRLKEGKRV